MNAVHDPEIRPSIGADLRAMRKARRVTLAELAADLGRSTGWLSQIERGLSAPSPDDLHTIASSLGFPVSMLFGTAPAPVAEVGYVVRAGARRMISGGKGLTEELLSPDLTDDFEVLRSVFAPGAALSDVKLRATQELGYLIEGQLDVTIAGREFRINAGDSFRIRGEAFRWSNPYDIPAVAIWVIAPPIY